ncbi:RagB/SusD family nutrient uptake outer membrane protein [Pseudoflavitalea sp. X16]|uniref:RagB/SusD family nutrient uptake outer membrane protein n=1 Tax=Paraflavitalea devenefica TaxID=2716334 RepID=UPI001423E1B5|nr:RagB/SusD family nutrient uptake outer membrane protein [Paraflavitalea devenefica]NII26844.1 RagB/SusD family nutrient uptake outer membrane protein [Paraflavitalea devenefica]
MKLNQITYILLAAGLSLAGCKRVLDLQPTDKLTADAIFGDPQGVKVYMANLYFQLPIEDFAFFRQGFNQNGGDPNNGGFSAAMETDEAVHTEFGDFVGDGDFHWWDQGYKLIRDVNLLIDYIPTLNIREEEKAALTGESAFIKAFAYFAMAKRYGGVSLMKKSQVFDGDPEKLKVPRSTEKETWDYVLELCDQAIDNLGTAKSRRASKWTALALKARAALHAASLAKFGNRITLTGDAVTQKLVGLDAGDANGYYKAAIDAAHELITNGGYALYRPNPANPAEAAENYRLLFQNPNDATNEAIMIKGFTLPGNNQGHNYDIWYQPAQAANGWPHPGRMNPTLDLVDVYESYTNPGQSAPVVTRVDGNTTDYNGFTSSTNYIQFNNPNEIFKDKDARLWGTAILPGTVWKNTPIIIQAGYVKPDGNAVIRTKDQITVGANTYYTYGAPDVTMYSGFDTYGGNNTRSGFSFKKFMNQNNPIVPGWNQSTTDWIEFRYAEVLLIYAEAVAESGQGDAALAAKCINDLRKRAGHTADITLTPENVQRERRVELAFENKRYWDLIRRREFHTEFNNRFMHSLLPLQDLRALPAIKYIFVRVNVPNTNPKTFQPKSYYRYIPGIGSNGLVQNPQY